MESFPENMSGACISNGNLPRRQPAGAKPNSSTTTNEPTKPRPSFSRRKSIDGSLEEGSDACCFGAIERNGSKQQHGNATEVPRYSGDGSKPEKALARICGPSRSKCGYCGGERMHVLSVRDANNRNIICHPAKDHNGDDEPPGAGKKLEQVDETRTSKSYGLLFDHIPYVTYEILINRGWRRSGKHLYRPHNFESCCPAISIRLDVLKFNRCNSLAPHDSQVETEGNDLARAILIRGSKSQRKVGKKILRELESYNRKCIHGSSESRGEAAFNSHVEDMQLEHRTTFSANQNEARFQSQVKRQHKKSRNQSPDRDHDKMDHNLNTDPQSNSTPTTTNLAAFKNGPQAHKIDHKIMHSLLDQLSRTVYQVITHEAIKSVASTQFETCENGENVERPRWAWWNDDEKDEDINIPKWCSFKVSQSFRRSKDQRSASANSITVVASTSACAAASGQSRGDIDKILLAHSVVDSLKRFIIDNPSSQCKSLEGNTPNLRVTEVSCHEKSGHVHVILDGAIAVATERNFEPIPGACQILPTESEEGFDPISEFLSRHEAIAHELSGEINTHKKNPSQQRFLTVRSVPANVSSLQPEVHQLFCRYQTAVHGDFDPYFGVDESSNTIGDVHEYDSFRQTNPLGFLNVETAYSHLDDVRRSKIKISYLAFYRFLGETPVAQDKVFSIENLLNEDGYDIHIPFGTYHQQYRLSTSKDAFDGPLVAVGVVDILPHCFSSVYSFYDPTLSLCFNLGKYSALREIEWVRRASKYRPDLHYYYLGYYIASCKKMTYKAEYKPSELLCPVNLKWVDFEVGKKRLEESSPIRHCCALSDCPASGEEPTKFAKSKLCLEGVTLDIGEKEPHLVQVGMLNKQGREFVDPFVNEFVGEVGADISHSFIIKLG